MNNAVKTKKSKPGCWIVGLGFLLFFSVCAVGSGIWISQLRRHHEVAERQVGGFDFLYAERRTWWQRLAGNIVGERAFDAIESANLEGSQGKADLRYVTRQPGFESLGIGGKHFNDGDMAFVAQASDLVEIDMRDVNVSSRGLAELRHCGKLRSAWLSGIWLDDEAAAGLSKANQLDLLYVKEAAITDAGLRDLGKLKSLQTLTLSECHAVNGSGLKHLSGLPQLETLTLANTPTSAEGVATLQQVKRLAISWSSWSSELPPALAGLDSVHSLIIADCPVTEADLAHIAKMKNLSYLVIHSKDITRLSVENLIKNPKLEHLVLGAENSELSREYVEEINNANPRILIEFPDEEPGFSEFIRLGFSP